ncbi:glycosyltransferase family 4 protein [Roseibacillus persicicus]|uniref:glycosyltransferase family 4 protein n=1 Tax=Roseibacillus persicicus TaxID=454148 RepID=UPI0016734848|nr:glycosyltransferase family 1 protein [Roseibacillus persicicus]
MQVYLDNLAAVIVKEDTYQIKHWPSRGEVVVNGGRWERALGKYWQYPNRVRRDSKVDLVHFLDHSSAHLIPKVAKNAKVVATLHDLIPLRFPGGLSKSQVERFERNVFNLKYCDAIISVSEYSKQEAVSLLGIAPELIHVLPNGVSSVPDRIESSEAVNGLRSKGADFVVLSVGSDLKRKNLRILPDALRGFEEETGMRAGLLRVGATLDETLANELGDRLEGRVTELGRASLKHLQSCYRNCDAVIVPSLYEGFGLPVLEALSFGKSVACSHSSSLPEVGGGCVNYFDPESATEAGKALVACFEELGEEGKRKNRLDRASKFSWREHLLGFYEIYDSLLPV